MTAIDLAFKRFGAAGNPLLILHGLFGAGRNWHSIARKFSENYRVYLPDLRNHGGSAHHPSMNYPALAADLKHFLDQQRIESAAVVGHSMGGKVAMWLALTEPERVHRLIAVDIAPVKYDHNFDPIMNALRGLPLDRIGNRKQADDWLAQSIRDAGLRQFLLQNLISEKGRYRWRIDLQIFQRTIPELLDFPSSANLKPYTGKVLFIGGSRSRYILPQHSTAISRAMESFQIEMLPDAGHWVHVDQPERFFTMVRDFLA